MITEQELKAQCTPDIIKKMVELAEGFFISKHENVFVLNSPFDDWIFFDYELNNFPKWLPLLIHRAVEGWNKKDKEGYYTIDIISNSASYMVNKYPMPKPINYYFENYKPGNLTQLELALLHCLIEIFEEEV